MVSIGVDLGDTYNSPDISFDENKTGSSTPKNRRDSFGPKIVLSAPKLAQQKKINTHDFSRYYHNQSPFTEFSRAYKPPGER